MTPAAILARAESMGLTLTRDGENIRVRGPGESIKAISALVKQHKAELLTALAANDADEHSDLEQLVREAATYYEATPEDLEIMDRLAQSDPDGLRRALQADPLRPFYRKARV